MKKTQQSLNATLENTEQALGGLENSLGNNEEASLLAAVEDSEANDGLPEGWCLAKLGEIIELKYGKSLPAKTRNGEGSPVYGSNGIIGFHSEPLLKGESIIVGRKGSFGEVQLSKIPCFPIDTTYFVDEFFGQPIKYWYYQLKDLPLTSLNRSTAIPGLNREDAYAQKIVLPPLAEQTVIAQTLDTLLAQVDNIKTRLDAIPKILKTFRQSVLAAAVSGKLTEEWRGENECLYPSKEELDKNIRIARRIKWEEQQLASFDRKGTKPKNDGWKNRYKEPLDGFMDEYSMTQIQAIPDEWLESNLDTVSITVTGKTPSTTKEENWNGSLPFISPSQVSKNGEILSSERMVSDLGAMNTPVLPANSILIVCIGTIGKVGLLDREAAFNQQLNALIPVEGMNTKFLYFWSKTLYDWLIKTSSAVVNAAIINKSRLSSAPCPLPSVEEQSQIVRRVEELFAFADQIEQQVKNAQGRVNNLTQSILAKAFRGELTTQWRAENPDLITGDNSAEALLAKIKLEREALKQKTKPKKKTALKKIC